MSTSTLWAQWYNALVAGFKLDPKTFQLVQGVMVVGNTSEYIWNILDAIPPDSINQLYNPAQANLFSSNYGSLILSLKSGGMVDEAVEIWNKAGGFTSQKPYSKTIANLQTALTRAPSISFSFDSSKEPTSVSETWARGKVRSVPLTEDAPQRSALSGRVVVDVTFDRVLTFTAAPLAKQSIFDPTLGSFEPWYLSSVLSKAYNDRSGRFWQPPPEWKRFFGDQGSMLRMATSLVVVDGITSKTSTPASLTAAEKNALTSSVRKTGFFPFSTLDLPEAAASAVVDPDDSGGGTVVISTPPGNPLVLGVIVTPIEVAI